VGRGYWAGGDKWKEKNDEKKGLVSWVMRRGWAKVEDRRWDNTGREDRLRGTILPLISLTWDTDTVLALGFMKDATDG
jgi:hypothetical protein